MRINIKIIKKLAVILCVAAMLTALIAPCCFAESAAPSDTTAVTDIGGGASGDENELGYKPSEATTYKGYDLGVNGIVAIITLAAISGGIAYFAARKASREGIYKS